MNTRDVHDEQPVSGGKNNLKAHILIGFVLTVVGAGSARFANEDRLPFHGPLHTVKGLVVSGYQEFKLDRSIITYEAKVPGARGYATLRRFYARKNSCGTDKLNLGDQVWLIVEDMSVSRRVYQVTGVDGCVLFDGAVRASMAAKNKVSNVWLSIVMFSLAFCSFGTAAYSFWKGRKSCRVN